MRVTVLGGGAAGPNPGAGCSGYLVSDGATKIVLDLGSGALAELLKHVAPDEIDGIVLSHMHQDHWLDLIPLRYRLKYSPNADGVRIPLHLPPSGKRIMDAIANVFDEDGEPDRVFGDVFEISTYDPSAGLMIGDLPISFAPSVHPVPCWMMRVRHPGGDLGYTADTGVNPEAASFLKGVRCLLVEATLLNPGSTGSHLTATEAGELATDCGAQEAVLCHLWAELGPDNLFNAARATYDGPLHVARPGLTIEWR